MRKDLQFKQRQMNDAEMTAAKLSVEKENREADLEKIKTLESRIEKEMETVSEGIQRMEDDISGKFARVDELRERFEMDKERLVKIRGLVGKYKTQLVN